MYAVLSALVLTVFAQDQIKFNIPATPKEATFYVAPQVPYTGLSLQFSTYMQYSVASYCPSTVTTRNWSCGKRCQGETTGTIVEQAAQHARTQSAGYVAYHPGRKEIIVAFRGTQSIQSALQDAQFWKSEPDFEPSFWKKAFVKSKFPSGIKIHAGFEDGYSFIRSAIQSSLAKVVSRLPEYKIVFTGHSLGGAMAEIAAIDFHMLTGARYDDRVSIYTFGQPRVGNPEWATFYNSKSFSKRFQRIVRDKDPVAQLPPRFLNYQFAGTQFEIDGRNSTRECAKSGPNGESDQCTDPILSLNILTHITGYYGWWTYPWFC
jgi:predicted lipase